MEIVRQPIQFEPDPFFAGDEVRISAVLYNHSPTAVKGDALFLVDGHAIASTTFSISPHRATALYTTWNATAGSHQFAITVTHLVAEGLFGSHPLPPPPAAHATVTRAVVADADNDGIGDPFDPDPDGDSLLLEQEQRVGTNPLARDTDGDGLDDGTEVTLGTSPILKDSDGDGISDGEEQERGLNPLARDTDGDGTDDGVDLMPTVAFLDGEWAQRVAQQTTRHLEPFASSAGRFVAERMRAFTESVATSLPPSLQPVVVPPLSTLTRLVSSPPARMWVGGLVVGSLGLIGIWIAYRFTHTTARRLKRRRRLRDVFDHHPPHRDGT